MSHSVMQWWTRERDYGGIKNNAKEQEVRKTDKKTGKSGKTQEREKQRGWNNEWEELGWERERCARMMWIHCLEAPREAGKSLYRELERWTLFMSKGLREEMLWEQERGERKKRSFLVLHVIVSFQQCPKERDKWKRKCLKQGCWTWPAC